MQRDEGKRAAYNGESRENNPYPVDSPEAAAWAGGYWSGLIDKHLGIEEENEMRIPQRDIEPPDEKYPEDDHWIDQAYDAWKDRQAEQADNYHEDTDNTEGDE